MYKLFVTLHIVLTFMMKIEGSEFQQFSTKCMGTEFKILIDHDNKDLCKHAAKAAFEEAARLNKIFSDYISDSEISLLSESSNTGTKLKLSDELLEVLLYSKSLAIKSDNAFDPTMGQLSRLWRVSRFRKSLPPEKSLLRAMKLKGVDALQIFEKEKEVALLKPGIVLDLGGIAKGYTADKMISSLNKFGINRSLVDAGGDLTLGNKPRGKSGWKIEIGGKSHPELPILSLENCSIATSGDSAQFIEINGIRYSHILNPETGYGLENLSQVTVIAENGMKADSFATAFSVLGPKRSKELFEKENFKAFFITQMSDKRTLEIID